MIRLTKEANNLHRLELDDITIWFSYETPIAFQVDNSPHEDILIITKNIWSMTTGKHLNIIDPDKGKRIEHSDFMKSLSRATRQKN